MATNLNPGADKTLVQAAYAASMANVPKDLSGTFEALSESYAETMKTVGEQWGEAIKTTSGLAKIAINGAIAHNQQMGALGDYNVMSSYANLNTNSVAGDGDGKYTTLGDEFRRIRNEIWQSRKEDPFGREGRRTRYKLKQEKDQILSDLAVLENADNFSNDLLINGLVDKNATGPLRLAMKNALHAFKTNSGVIQEGEYKGYKAVLKRDANNKLTFVLQDPQGNNVTGTNSSGKLVVGEKGDKPFSISVDQMGSLVTEKMDATTKSNIDTLFNNLMTQGKIKGSTYMRNKLINDLKPYVDNETSLHQIIHKALGDNATSWVEDLNNPSVSSATIFRAMTELSVSGGTDNNITEAIDANADGKAGLTKEDFMGANGAENYNIVKQALLDRDSKYYNADVTRDEFLQYAGDVGKTMFNYGVGMRETDDGDGSGKGTKYGGFGSYAFDSGGTGSQDSKQIKWSEAVKRRERLQDGLSFKGAHGDWKPIGDGNYKGEYGNEEEIYSAWDVAEIEALWQSGESEDDFLRSEEIKVEKEMKKRGGVTMDILSVSGDTEVSEQINSLMGLSKRTDLMVVPYTWSNAPGTNLAGSDNIWTNDVMIIDTNPDLSTYDAALKDGSGNVYRFGTGDSATKEDVALMNKLLSKYLKNIKSDTKGEKSAEDYLTE